MGKVIYLNRLEKKVNQLEVQIKDLQYCLNRAIDHIERLNRRAGLENYPPSHGSVTTARDEP